MPKGREIVEFPHDCRSLGFLRCSRIHLASEVLLHTHLIDEAFGQVLLQSFLHVQLFAEAFAPVDAAPCKISPIDVPVCLYVVRLAYLEQAHELVAGVNHFQATHGVEDRFQDYPSEYPSGVERLQRGQPVGRGGATGYILAVTIGVTWLHIPLEMGDAQPLTALVLDKVFDQLLGFVIVAAMPIFLLVQVRQSIPICNAISIAARIIE